MFLFLVSSFTTWSFARCVPVSSVVVQEHLVHAFESFSQVVLKGREGSADSRGPKAVSDEAEVSQAALNAWFQNRGGPAVPNRCPVLGQEICKFFTKLLCSKQHVFPGVEVAGVRVLSVQVFRNSLGWELRFADVPKIPG